VAFPTEKIGRLDEVKSGRIARNCKKKVRRSTEKKAKKALDITSPRRNITPQPDEKKQEKNGGKTAEITPLVTCPEHL
jgi:hypothetical protein